MFNAQKKYAKFDIFPKFYTIFSFPRITRRFDFVSPKPEKRVIKGFLMLFQSEYMYRCPKIHYLYLLVTILEKIEKIRHKKS